MDQTKTHYPSILNELYVKRKNNCSTGNHSTNNDFYFKHLVTISLSNNDSLEAHYFRTCMKNSKTYDICAPCVISPNDF